MADLEETILKRNVPGRWSRHEEADQADDTDLDLDGPSQVNGRGEEEQLLDLARNLAYEDVPEPVRQSILAQRMRNPATGVKGVIADYRADQALAAAQRQAERDYREAVLRRIAIGASSASAEEETPPTVFAAEAEQLSDDEEAFLQELRNRRMKGIFCPTIEDSL